MPAAHYKLNTNFKNMRISSSSQIYPPALQSLVWGNDKIYETVFLRYFNNREYRAVITERRQTNEVSSMTAQDLEQVYRLKFREGIFTLRLVVSLS